MKRGTENKDAASRRPFAVHAGIHHDMLLAIQRCEWSRKKGDVRRQELHQYFEQAMMETRLPERPDYKAANGLLVEARRKNSQ